MTVPKHRRICAMCNVGPAPTVKVTFTVFVHGTRAPKGGYCLEKLGKLTTLFPLSSALIDTGPVGVSKPPRKRKPKP